MNRYESEYNYFNTTLKLVFESNNYELVKAINHQIILKVNELQYLFNYYDSESALHLLNLNKEIEITSENTDLRDIIILSKAYKKLTNNYFNIDNTFTTDDTIFIDNNTIAIKNELDLGAIAKGYFLDYCSDLLKQYDEKVFINFGGSILCYWDNLRVGLKNVHNLAENLLVITLEPTETLHTSATYEQKLPNNLSHIYQPIRHYEANHLKSVTVIDTISNRCDALATAIFAMETPLGVAFCKEHKIKVIIIDNDKIYISQEIFDKITLNVPIYELITF